MEFLNNHMDWIRFGRVPMNNENRNEGLLYFERNIFFLDNPRRYGEIPNAHGYVKLHKNDLKFWVSLIVCWNKYCRDIHSEGNWIFRSLNKNDFQTNLPNCYYTEYVSRENLDQENIKVHSGKLVTTIDASVMHMTGDQQNPQAVVHHIKVPDAKLIVWIETNFRDGELFWVFKACVYSWIHCRVEPLSNCSEQTVKEIEAFTASMIREWSHLCRKAADGTLLTPVEREQAAYRERERLESQNPSRGALAQALMELLEESGENQDTNDEGIEL